MGGEKTPLSRAWRAYNERAEGLPWGITPPQEGKLGKSQAVPASPALSAYTSQGLSVGTPTRQEPAAARP